MNTGSYLRPAVPFVCAVSYLDIWVSDWDHLCCHHRHQCGPGGGRRQHPRQTSLSGRSHCSGSGGHTQLQCRAGQIYSPWSQQISSHHPFIKNTKQTMHEDTFNMTAMLYMDSYFLCMHASPLRIQ